MKRLLILLALLLSLSACSNKKSFVVVEESEFGDWQWEINEITKILNSMDLSPTDGDGASAILYEVEGIRERMERLDKRINKNFIHSDELGSRGLPTRYAN